MPGSEILSQYPTTIIGLIAFIVLAFLIALGRQAPKAVTLERILAVAEENSKKLDNIHDWQTDKEQELLTKLEHTIDKATEVQERTLDFLASMYPKKPEGPSE